MNTLKTESDNIIDLGNNRHTVVEGADKTISGTGKVVEGVFKAGAGAVEAVVGGVEMVIGGVSGTAKHISQIVEKRKENNDQQKAA